MNDITKVVEEAGENDYRLYHNLDLFKLKSVLISNSFRLPLSASNESEEKLGVKKMFYLSFARTPSSGYIADRSSGLSKVNEDALLVIDRRLLEKQRGVSLVPVQYYSVDGTGRAMGSAREAEERLFSDKPLLTGVINTIVEVRIMTTRYFNDRHYYALRQVYTICKRKGIKTKLFSMDNYQGYLLGKEKLKDRDAIYEKMISTKFKPDNYGSSYEARRSSIVRKRSKYMATDSFQDLAEYVYNDSLKDLGKQARERLYYLVRGYTADHNFYGYYKTEIHNLRGITTSTTDRDKLNRMLKHMKVKSLREFFSKLQTKWENIYNNESK